MKLKIIINGTDTNPYLKYGLLQSPFGQISKAELAWFDAAVNSLAAEPVKSTDDIRQRLRGCSEEFVDICCREYVPGKKVTFHVTLPTRKGQSHG